MIHKAVIIMIMGGFLAVNNLAYAENPEIAVNVYVGDESEGVEGIVLLVNSGRANESSVSITDEEGKAYLPALNCNTCIITALDPRGLFYAKTTEFGGRTKSVVIFMQIRPVINKVGDPGAMWVDIIVHDPTGTPLAKQNVIVRPRDVTLTLESNWFYTDTTDSKGRIRAKLLPGEYIVARLTNGEVMEASFSVKVKQSKQCAEEEEKRIQSSFTNTNTVHFLTVRLSEASSTSGRR